jgi:hypothetical protein
VQSHAGSEKKKKKREITLLGISREPDGELEF